jgi:hypothetical protein
MTECNRAIGGHRASACVACLWRSHAWQGRQAEREVEREVGGITASRRGCRVDRRRRRPGRARTRDSAGSSGSTGADARCRRRRKTEALALPADDWRCAPNHDFVRKMHAFRSDAKCHYHAFARCAQHELSAGQLAGSSEHEHTTSVCGRIGGCRRNTGRALNRRL